MKGESRSLGKAKNGPKEIQKFGDSWGKPGDYWGNLSKPGVYLVILGEIWKEFRVSWRSTWGFTINRPKYFWGIRAPQREFDIQGMRGEG